MNPRVLAVVGVLAAVSVPATAQAVHWPYFGGDAGRSGLQPVDEGATPVSFTYALTGAEQRGIVTPIITTAGGGPTVQRVAYGTSAGRVHLRVMGSGLAITPEDGRDIDEGAADADVFGFAFGFTGFADSSVATALGQLYVLHNDNDAPGTSDVQIAQIDEASGEVVQQFDVPDTEDEEAESTPVLTGPDQNGGRVLFFTLSDGEVRRLPIAAAGSRNATFGALTRTNGARATATASPTFLNLRNSAGAATPHVAIGTRDGTVATFATADLAEGPASEQLRPAPSLPLDPGPIARTPVVPVGPDGMPPANAPFVYVGVDNGDSTTAHKLAQEGNGGLVERAESESLNGAPATAVAVSQKATATPGDGKVVVTTNDNLYTINTSDLRGTQQLLTAAEAETVGADTFRDNVALVAGNFGYVTTDRGRQVVFSLSDTKRVPASEFTQDAGNAQASAAVGQPSLSRGFIQFGTDRGLFTYRNRDLVPPATALTAPADGATVSGVVNVAATASDARGIGSVTFRLNGQTVATDTAPDAGSPFNAAAPATFSGALDTRGRANGTYTLDAVASDGTLTTVSGARRIVVANTGTGTGPGTGGPGGGSGGPGSGTTGRVKAARITATLRPSRDRRAPYRFRVTGRVTLPSGVTPAQGCGQGRFSLQYKAGRKTISTRRASLTRGCTYRSTVRFRNRKRFGKRTKLTVRVRFLGNDRLRPQAVRTLRPRVR